MVGIGTRTDTRANEKWEVLETGFQINVGKGGLSESWGKAVFATALLGQPATRRRMGRSRC